MNPRCVEPREGRDLELALWAGGDLPPAEAARVEAHLETCPGCRALAAGLRAGRDAMAALATEPVDPGALERVRRGVRHRIEEWERRRSRRTSRTLNLARALAAALAVALLGASVWWYATRPAAERGAERRAEGREPAAEAAPGGPPVVADAPPPPPPEPARTAPPRVPPPDPPEPSPVQRAAAEPPAPLPERDTEPTVIQVVSDDPDIVYYWLVEPEETEDETVSS